jgi:hypothetical protein
LLAVAVDELYISRDENQQIWADESEHKYDAEMLHLPCLVMHETRSLDMTPALSNQPRHMNYIIDVAPTRTDLELSNWLEMPSLAWSWRVFWCLSGDLDALCKISENLGIQFMLGKVTCNGSDRPLHSGKPLFSPWINRTLSGVGQCLGEGRVN